MFMYDGMEELILRKNIDSLFPFNVQGGTYVKDFYVKLETFQ